MDKERQKRQTKSERIDEMQWEYDIERQMQRSDVEREGTTDKTKNRKY